jgi:hypothetical protein
MRRKAISFLLSTLLLLSIHILPVSGVLLSFEVEDNYYQPGDEVKITGVADTNQNLSIVVDNHHYRVFNEIVNISDNGSFSLLFNLENDTLIGVYIVTASQGEFQKEGKFIVTPMPPDEIYQHLRNQTIKSKEKLELLRNRLNDGGLELPQKARDNLQWGWEAFERAETSFNEGNHNHALEELKEALEYFKDSLQIINDEMEQGIPQPSNETLLMIRLEDKIIRTNSTLQSFTRTIDRLDGENLNLIEIRELIADAEGHLQAAIENLEDELLEKSMEELENAVELLAEIRQLIQGRVQTLKPRIITRFQQNLANRIHFLNGILRELEGRLGPDKIRKAETMLQSIEKKYMEIQRLLEQGDTQSATTLLEHAQNEVDNALNKLNGQNYGTMLVEMNRLQAKIQTLNQTQEKLEKKGVNAREIKNRLENAVELSQKFQNRIKEGNIDEAKEVLKDPKEDIDRARDELSPRNKDDVGSKNQNKGSSIKAP